MPRTQATIDEIVSFLRTQIVRRIRITEDELSNDIVLADLGLKSLDAVLISGAVEDRFEIEVDPILMFEYKTVNAVAERLSQIIEAT